jgi:hypothetical protein
VDVIGAENVSNGHAPQMIWTVSRRQSNRSKSDELETTVCTAVGLKRHVKIVYSKKLLFLRDANGGTH